MGVSNTLEIRNIYTDRSNFLAIFAIGNGGNITFHNLSGDQAWISTVTANLVKLKVFSGCPNIVTEVSDAIFLPQYNCLFDNQGHRIIDTCILRGIDLNEIIDAPETISLPKSMYSVVVPLVYLSRINHHWGHFLTEGISRLWVLDELFATDNKFLFFGDRYSNSGETDNSINTFLDSATAGHPVYIGVPGPLRIRQAIVPSPSFQNRGRAYSGHAIFPQKVADRMLIERNPKAKSNQPVYFSRSRLSNSISGRLIRNEAQLENFLGSRGVLVCYPETMTLAEQVSLVNSHSTFVGCWGSALHSLILS
jgi:hypothetical protein